MGKRLYKNEREKKIAGVASGVADYFKADVTIIRVIFVVAAFTNFYFTAIAYILAALIMPTKPEHVFEEEEEVLDETGHPIKNFSNNRQVLGFAFVGIGGMLLLSRTIPWFDRGIMTAVAIILVGAYILFAKKSPDA